MSAEMYAKSPDIDTEQYLEWQPGRQVPFKRKGRATGPAFIDRSLVR